MKTKHKRIAITVILLICVAVCICFAVLLSQRQYFDSETTKISDNDEYTSPVDFEALHEINEHIYAWLDIPDTEISYPIIQHPSDDTYYLRRNIKKKKDIAGTVFTEAGYSGTDFTDPVTVAYGHNMDDGSMFGTLQSTYSSEKGLREHSEFVVYLPDKELHYTVFAAVPFDNRHILYNYDFTEQRTFRLFFEEIMSVRSLESVFAEDASVSPDDHILILSTCLKGNRSERFLVCGKLVKTVSADTAE